MTTKIIINACKPKLLKISLSYLLQNEAGFSTKTADRTVNAIAKGEPVEFEIDDDKAASFIEEASYLGAIASVQPPGEGETASQ